MRRTALILSLLASVTATAPAQEPPAKAMDPAELIRQLGDDDYRARKAAEQALAERGDEVRDALRSAANDHDDPEVRWRAQRLLRRLDRAGDGDAGGDGSGKLRKRRATERPRRYDTDGRGHVGVELDHLFDEMFERMERELGLDVPRRSFFHDEFFQDLQRQMEALRHGLPDDLQGTGSATRVQIGPDGVRVEVTEREADGQERRKVYEAPDLESFRAKYPEIADRYLGGEGGLRIRFGDPLPGGLPGLDGPRVLTPRGGARRAPGGGPVELAPLDPPREGERLGVFVGELDPAVRRFLGLGADQGLAVEDVQPDSLASRLGVRKGDIVLKIGDTTIGGPADVRRALRAVDKGKEVRVEVNRRGAVETLTAEKLHAAPAKTLQPADRGGEGRGGNGR